MTWQVLNPYDQKCIGSVDLVDADGQQPVVGAGREHRAAHGDDAGDEVGPAHGQAMVCT